MTTYPQFAADLVGVTADADKEILPNTFQACEAYVMNLSAQQPRFSVTSPFAEYDTFAQKLGRALDRYAREMYLAEVLQDIARNSFFSVGVAKVYQASSAAVGMEVDYRMDPGRPYVQSIPIKRIVRDTKAESPEEASFIGDLYEVSYEEAIRSKRFPRWARQLIRELSPNTRGDSEEDEDREELARVDDTLHFCDVYIRSKRAVWTFVCDANFNLRIKDPIQRVKWHGAECGPYHFLNMGPAPGLFYPASPGQIGKLLNELDNSLYRKLEDQALRMKNVGTAKNPEDITSMRDAKDGEYKEFQDADSIRTIRMDGPDQALFGFKQDVGKHWSAANNNLEMQLATSQQADTASQERMMQMNASRVQAFYQERWVAFVRGIAGSLAKQIWDDAHLKIPGTYQIPGTEFSVRDDLDPAGVPGSRVGTFPLYTVDIDPQSMAYQSAGQRAQFLDAQVTKWMPYAPFLAEQGMRLDVQGYFEAMADLGNAPQLRRVFKTNQPPMNAEQNPGMSRLLNSSSTRHYDHTSRGGGGQQEQDPMQYFAAAQQGRGDEEAA